MSAKVYGNAPGSTIPMSTGFDEWCWGQNIFYAGFGFTNWPNDVCNDLVLQKDGKCRFVCARTTTARRSPTSTTGTPRV